jgi:CcmD family protein
VNALLARPVGERIAADWVVMIVALVVWGALFLYLMRLDRRVRELDKR